MADLLTFENLANLAVLIFLQAVLGFDNLLYISIESQRAPKEHQARVRFWGIIIAVALRIVLLFTMIQLIDALKEPFYIFDMPGIITGGAISRLWSSFLAAFLSCTPPSKKSPTC